MGGRRCNWGRWGGWRGLLPPLTWVLLLPPPMWPLLLLLLPLRWVQVRELLTAEQWEAIRDVASPASYFV